MFEVMMYDGGVYRSAELFEAIEDVGGTVLHINRSAQMLMVTMSIPEEDRHVIEGIAKEIGGDIRSVPLAGTEIAVIGCTLGRHHMPHPVCDIAEAMRQGGAISVVMGLARGRGKSTSQISKREISIIDEYDAAIFMLGNFKPCVEAKRTLLEDISAPVILVSGPMPDGMEDCCEAIVSGVGRKAERMKSSEERAKLAEISDAVNQVLLRKKRQLEEDPLFIHPAELKLLLESYEPIDMCLRPAPIVLHLDGLRVKIPYREHKDYFDNLEVYGRKLPEIADIIESKLEDSSTLIKIRTMSQIEDMDRQAKE
ncbi:MAG: methyl-coenzyme M reductase family protein [Candidatus Methanomethylophilaceae archaeon]|nr:methyl-coenzyme M reductase family protein [Candidatus Methanomethylophilaceae archaeon]